MADIAILREVRVDGNGKCLPARQTYQALIDSLALGLLLAKATVAVHGNGLVPHS